MATSDKSDCVKPLEYPHVKAFFEAGRFVFSYAASANDLYPLPICPISPSQPNHVPLQAILGSSENKE